MAEAKRCPYVVHGLSLCWHSTCLPVCLPAWPQFVLPFGLCVWPNSVLAVGPSAWPQSMVSLSPSARSKSVISVGLSAWPQYALSQPVCLHVLCLHGPTLLSESACLHGCSLCSHWACLSQHASLLYYVRRALLWLTSSVTMTCRVALLHDHECDMSVVIHMPDCLVAWPHLRWLACQLVLSPDCLLPLTY